MKISKVTKEFNNEATNHILFQHIDNESVVKMGYVTVPPGERVPKEGLSCHDEDEYSYILKGCMTTQSGAEEIKKVAKGSATFIPANEKHWALNESEEPCEIVYALVKHK
ncbi:MAG: cupin domain-containing protein [Heyndrickxia sp.]